MKYLGLLSYFLGIQVTSTQGGLLLHQSKYSRELLHRAGMTDCKPIPSPAGFKYVVLSEADKKKYEDPTNYKSLVGTLQYLIMTKPEIQYAVNTLC